MTAEAVLRRPVTVASLLLHDLGSERQNHRRGVGPGRKDIACTLFTTHWSLVS